MRNWYLYNTTSKCDSFNGPYGKVYLDAWRQSYTKKLGADAIINIRFSNSVIMQGASEILAYGTAVKLEK